MLCRIESAGAGASPTAEPGWALGWGLALSAPDSLGRRDSLTLGVLPHFTPLYSGYGNIWVHIHNFSWLINQCLKNPLCSRREVHSVRICALCMCVYKHAKYILTPIWCSDSPSLKVSLLQMYCKMTKTCLFNASDTVMCNPYPIF